MSTPLSALRPHAVAVFALVVLLFGVLLAVPAVADEQIHEPIYPVRPSDAPEKDKDKGTISVPDIVAEEENFHLAVIDSMQSKIDNQKVLDGVRQIMGETNAKIVVGVDSAENAREGGAAKFIRAMTMFGPTSYLLLHDDWPDSVDSKGYVEDGWIVIGLLMPTEAGEGGEIAIDKAWNVSGDRAAALDNTVAALRPVLDEEDYTQAVIEAVRTTTAELKAPRDYLGTVLPESSSRKTILAIVVLGIMAAVLVPLVLIRRTRARNRRGVAQRLVRTEQLGDLLRSQSRELEASRLAAVGLQPGSLSGQRAALFAQQAPAINAAARQAADSITTEEAASPAELENLAKVSACQGAVLAAVEALNGLLGPGTVNRRRWGTLISAHGRILEDCARFLDEKGAATLEAAKGIRQRLVTDTDVLQEARQWLEDPRPRSIEPAQMLDRLWQLRIELNEELEKLVAQARQKGLKIPGTLSSYPCSPAEDEPRRADDISVLERAARLLGSWLSEQPKSMP